MMDEMIPRIIAPKGWTSPAAGVMATKPARIPDTSPSEVAFPCRMPSSRIQVKAPAAAAVCVTVRAWAVKRPLATELALPSALCYHAYEALSGSVTDGLRMTVRGHCWRREKETRPLERGRAFTMRELVHVGSAASVREFRAWSTDRVCELAARLGLDYRVEPATDPFYAPTARGQKLLQQVKGLKTELALDIGGGRRIAAASFNDHEQFFGSCFGITLPDGATASSGCTAFGLERWVLAFLVTHGIEPTGWPEEIWNEEVTS